MFLIINDLNKSLKVKIVFGFAFILTVWWVSMYFRGLTEGIENNAFTLVYPWLSLFGGIIGLIIARGWGGFKSYFGRALSFLSLGLLAQFFGQVSYACYIYIASIEVPYPSIGDLGYFGSIFLYIVAVYYLGESIGVKFTLKNYKDKALAVLLPILMLAVSFQVFLQDYDSESGGWLKTFLDFGYPLGQAIYVSLALLVFLLSRNVLGGVMRKPILFLIFALIVQYVSDFTFLRQVNNGTWYVGGINDYMYLVSYALMSLSLIQFGIVYKRIMNS